MRSGAQEHEPPRRTRQQQTHDTTRTTRKCTLLTFETTYVHDMMMSRHLCVCIVEYLVCSVVEAPKRKTHTHIESTHSRKLSTTFSPPPLCIGVARIQYAWRGVCCSIIWSLYNTRILTHTLTQQCAFRVRICASVCGVIFMTNMGAILPYGCSTHAH